MQTPQNLATVSISIADNSAIDQWRESKMPTNIVAQLQNIHITPINFQELLLMTNVLSRKDRLLFLHSKAADRIITDADNIETHEIKCLMAGIAPAPIPISDLVCKPTSPWTREWLEVITKADQPIPAATIDSIQSFKDGQRKEILFFAAVLSNLAKIKKSATITDFTSIQTRLNPFSEQQLLAEIPTKTDRSILFWVDSLKDEWATIATYRYLISKNLSPDQIESIPATSLRTTGCWLSHRYLIEIARDCIAGQYRTPEGGDAFDTRQVIYIPHINLFVTKDGYAESILRKILPSQLLNRLGTF